MSDLSKFLETFPQDIQDAAWAEVNGSHGYIDSTEGAVTIARAILAERHRCADIAQKTSLETFASQQHRQQLKAWRDRVSSAILTP